MLSIRLYSFSAKISVRFTNPMQYWIKSCTKDWSNFQCDAESDNSRIWTIKRDTDLVLLCNNKSVINFTEDFKDNNACKEEWNTYKDQDRFWFHAETTVSYSLKAGKIITFTSRRTFSDVRYDMTDFSWAVSEYCGTSYIRVVEIRQKLNLSFSDAQSRNILVRILTVMMRVDLFLRHYLYICFEQLLSVVPQYSFLYSHDESVSPMLSSSRV